MGNRMTEVWELMFPPLNAHNSAESSCHCLLLKWRQEQAQRKETSCPRSLSEGVKEPIKSQDQPLVECRGLSRGLFPRPLSQELVRPADSSVHLSLPELSQAGACLWIRSS